MGFDFAPNMIERGKKSNAHLDLRLLKESLKFPLPDNSADGVILSTVMTCISSSSDLGVLIKDLYRILRPSGRVYISDFLITENEKYSELYDKYKSNFDCYGVFVTSEGGKVRHFEKDYILDLIKFFELEWYEEVDFETMNKNPVRTFHLTALKPAKRS